tara:strand:+ start:27173 stop:27430 length:258 start_codon:yes stop_codon:yes gene_type:complete
MTNSTKTRFVTHDEAQDFANQLQMVFEVGTLNSQSRVTEIAFHACELLQDEGITSPRKSLCLMIAKMAQTIFQGTLMQTQQQLNN